MSKMHWNIWGWSLAFVSAAVLAQPSNFPPNEWWQPGADKEFPGVYTAVNAQGIVATRLDGGAQSVKDHPFFKPLGRNGRACVTCHQPADGMSLSVKTIQARWEATQGKDPLFAAIDGSNCPSLDQSKKESHSLLLEKGLIRIARPWPPQDFNGKKVKPEFSIEVVRDPAGCNLDKSHGLKSPAPYVSVYRRPRAATNTRYLTAIGFDFEPKTGLPVLVDAVSGKPTSGNLLSDSRALTLDAQARDAMRWHLEALGTPDGKWLDGILSFEQKLTTAQVYSHRGGDLTSDGGRGGIELLRQAIAGELQSTARKQIWSEEFLNWKSNEAAPQDEKKFRESVRRGVDVFSKKTFLITDSGGLNNIPLGNPLRDGCAICHNMQRSGMDVAPGQIDLGTTNLPHADPAPQLPLFKLTCQPTAKPHPYLGKVIYTHDPGFALTTGQCRDIGKITMQNMRGLASRAPYFSNGSAANLRAIVEFYNRRYRIGYTEQEMQDLTNLLSVL